MDRSTPGIQKKQVTADSLLQAIVSISEIAVNHDNPDDAINAILRLLGEAAAADRAYLFVARNEPATGNIVCDNLWEWCREGITPQVGSAMLIGVPIEAFPMYSSHFLLHRHFQAIVSQIQDPMTREALAVQDIQAALLVPLFSGHDFAGFAGFDDCTNETVWTDLEIGFLSAAAMQLVGIFRRSMLEKDRKALEMATVLSATESGLSGIMEWNVGTGMVTISQAILEWVGIAPGKQSIAADIFGSCIAEEDRAVLAHKTEAFLTAGDDFFSCEYRLKNKYGELRWVVSQHVVVERTPDGNPVRLVGTITDVDSQKRMLVNLRESEAKISSILNATRENYFIFDHDLRIIDCHVNTAEELMESPEFFIGKKLHDVFPPSFARIAEARLHEAATSDTVLQFDYALPLQGGKHYFQARLTRLASDASKILVSVLDVTRQRQLEQNLAATKSELANTSTELERRRHKYQINVSESPLAILVFDGSGSITEFNKAAEWLFPELSDPAEKGNMQMVFAASRGCSFTDCLECLTIEQRCSRELEVKSVTGREVSIIFTSAKIAENEYIAFCQDITELQVVMNELAEYKRRFEAFFSAVDDIIYFFDLATGVAVSPNNSRERLIGGRAREGQSDLDFWMERIHPEDRGLISGAENVLYETGKAELNYRIYTLTGELRWLWDRYWVVRDAAGKPVRVEGIISDITGVKAAEEAVQQSLLKERDLNAMKNKFISATSHEFRTPLTAIYSSTELLEYYGEQWLPEKRKYHYNKIQRSVRQLQGLLDDILFISKTDSGRITVMPAPTDLPELATAMRDQVLAAEKCNNPIHIKNTLQSAEQFIDPKLVGQILQNLIGNAVKYSPDGAPVLVELGEDHASITLKVSDQGIGIPESEQPRIFDRFVRGSNADTIDGTGLGLSIVKNTVDLLQGTVHLFSRVGTGTSITITLPKQLIGKYV